MNAGHGIEQVGQMGSAGVVGRTGVFIIGIGVGDGNGADVLGLGHEFRGTGQLGRNVHDPHQTAAVLVELAEAFKIRLFQVVGVLRAPLFIGEVGAFHLDAPEYGAALGGLIHQTAGVGKGGGEHFVRQGHGGGGEGGDTAAGIVGGHPLQALVIPVGEVGTGISVAVDFHKAGNHGGALQVNGIGGDFPGENLGEYTVFHFKSARMELKIGAVNSCIAVKH